MWWGSRSEMVWGSSVSSSLMKGCSSVACTRTNLKRHRWAILRNVSHAMSCTPGCSSCMNSNSFLTTVLRNFQCAFRKRGYCPTTYMMFEAITALLSLPRVNSHKPSSSLMTVTKKCFSSSTFMAPEMEPMAQQSVLNPCLDHCGPTWKLSFSIIICSVSRKSRWVRKTSASRIVLCCATASTSRRCSRVTSPEASSTTTSTSSGLGILSTRMRRRLESTAQSR
mmetsp:Transcript_53360/g.115845  ORF Transcript_53360/g.115845 Transcript_53360/m.115845 type:complete len:224 (-) Transcript_53360:86-757(-)